MMRASTWRIRFAVLLVFFITIGIRLYWINHKEGLNVDEGLSITLASYNRYMLWNDNYESGRTYTGQELKAISLWENASLRNAIGDVYRLHLNNNGDAPHTSLYYSLLRLAFAGRATGDYRDIIRIGTGLNLVFFTISFFAMYQLLRLLFDRDSVILAGLLLCFLNTGSISSTLALRPYPLQETALIVATYYCVLYCRKILNGETFNTWRDLTLLAFVGAFVLMSAYFSIIYGVLLGCPIVGALLLRRRMNQVGFFIAVVVFSIGLAQTAYANYLDGLIRSRRSEEALSVLSSSELASKLTEAVSVFIGLLGTYILYWPLVLCLGVALFITIIPQTAKRFAAPAAEHERSAWIVPSFLVASTAIFSVIVLYLAPYKFLRYIMAVFPIMALLNTVVLNRLKTKAAITFGCIMAGVCVLYAMDWSHIENLSLEKPEIYSFTNKPDIPVLILSKNYWKYADMIPYLSDSQRYEFPASEQELESRLSELPRAFVVLETETYPTIRTQREYSFHGTMNYFDLYEVTD